MKVMCINDAQWINQATKVIMVGPKYGEIVTVMNEIEEKGLYGYELVEYKPAQGTAYEKSEFIPLSDKDETEYSEAIMDELFVRIEKMREH